MKIAFHATTARRKLTLRIKVLAGKPKRKEPVCARREEEKEEETRECVRGSFPPWPVLQCEKKQKEERERERERDRGKRESVRVLACESVSV